MVPGGPWGRRRLVPALEVHRVRLPASQGGSLPAGQLILSGIDLGRWKRLSHQSLTLGLRGFPVDEGRLTRS